MLVIYESVDEVLVFPAEHEDEYKAEYFDENSDRDIDDYDRSVRRYAQISFRTHVR